MANAPVDPHVEIERLRKQLDTQPSCLMRIGTDGTVLAANDAARNLLGVASLSEVLNVPFMAWLAKSSHEPWRLFAERVASGSSASLECEVTALSGSHRSALLHGIPVLDHPDRLPSMIVAARDVSDRPEIEASLEEREGKIRELELELDNLQSQLVHAQSQLTQAQTQLAETAEEQGRLKEELDAVSARRDEELRAAEATGEQRRLEEALIERLAVIEQLEAETRRLHAHVETLRADAERTAAVVHELEGARVTQDAAHLAERARLEDETRRIEERLDQDARRLGERYQRQVDDTADAGRRWQAESLGQRAAIEQLEATLREREQAVARLDAERLALREQLEVRAALGAEQATDLADTTPHPHGESFPLLEGPEAQTQAALERAAASNAALVTQHEQALAEQASAQQYLETELAARAADVEGLQTERARLRQDRDRARSAQAALERSLSELDHERLRRQPRGRAHEAPRPGRYRSGNRHEGRSGPQRQGCRHPRARNRAGHCEGAGRPATTRRGARPRATADGAGNPDRGMARQAR